MKKCERGTVLIQSLFLYFLIIFIILFSMDIFQNLIHQVVNQARSLKAHQILKWETERYVTGLQDLSFVKDFPPNLWVERRGEIICVSYLDAAQTKQEICNCALFKNTSRQFVD